MDFFKAETRASYTQSLHIIAEIPTAFDNNNNKENPTDNKGKSAESLDNISEEGEVDQACDQPRVTRSCSIEDVTTVALQKQKPKLQRRMSFSALGMNDMSRRKRKVSAFSFFQPPAKPTNGCPSEAEVARDKSIKMMGSHLLSCIRSHDCQKIKLILKRKIVDVTDFAHDICFHGCKKCVKQCLKTGCLVDMIDASGFSLLHAAVMSENTEVVEYLLESRARVDSSSNEGLTVLHMAVMLHNIHMVHSLTSHGADACQETRLELTPLQMSIDLQRTQILDYFIMCATYT